MEDLIFIIVCAGIGGVVGYQYAKRKYGITKKAD